MSTILIEVSDQHRSLLDELARTRGVTTEQIAKEAVEHVADAQAEEQQKFLAWREAMLKVEGIWANRDDLPDFEDIRRSLDRDLWKR